MNNGKTVGMLLFIGGIVLLMIYGLYLGFEELIESLDFISGVFIGLILIGLIVLIISIIFEQRRDTKETMKDIKKEDLEP
jgi:membrane protease YdiL (CAAX protease family)